MNIHQYFQEFGKKKNPQRHFEKCQKNQTLLSNLSEHRMISFI